MVGGDRGRPEVGGGWSEERKKRREREEKEKKRKSNNICQIDMYNKYILKVETEQKNNH